LFEKTAPLNGAVFFRLRGGRPIADAVETNRQPGIATIFKVTAENRSYVT
jgi:hypothetical protein